MLIVIRRALVAGLILTASAASAANDGAEAQDIDRGTLPAWVAPAPSIPGEVPGSYGTARNLNLVRDTQILAQGSRSERYEYHALRINHPAALAEAGTIALNFAASFQRLSLHALAIRRNDQVINLLDTVAFHVVAKEDSLNRNLLSGTRSAIAQVQDLRVGDVLEYAYTIRGLNPVFGDRPAFVVPWNSMQPVALRRVRLVEPAPGLTARVIRPRGVEIIDISRRPTSLGHETLFEGRNIAPAFLEPSLPRGFDPFVALTLTPFAEWSDVRRWGNELFRVDESNPSHHVDELLERLRKLPSKHAAIAESVRFVQDEIRYFSLSIGENSHRPYLPEEVLARRFGDCKDKSLLLTRLLRGLGIEAYPALVSHSRHRGIERFPPMPNVFDHVVVNFQFDGLDYWIDPTRTSQALAYDKQGVAMAGATALRIGAGDAGLAAIPENTPGTLSIVESVTVTAIDAPVSVEIDTRLTGILAEVLRDFHAKRSKDANEAHYQELFARRYTGARATRPVSIRDEPDTGALRLTESYEVGDFFRSDGVTKRYAILGAQQLGVWLAANVPPSRIHPYAVPGGKGRFSYEGTVHFPAGIVGREDPITNHLANEAFELQTSRSFRGNTMRFAGELRIAKGQIAPEDFSDYLEKTKRAREALIDVVVVAPENMLATDGRARKTLAQRSREENLALIKSFDKAIAGGQLGEGDAATAYARRGMARLTVGDSRGAQADFDAALRLKPLLGGALIGRALVSFREGRMSAAEDDLTRAITLGGDVVNAYLRRGHVRYMSGRYAEALSDFDLAEKANNFGINRDFILIWKVLATKALGRNPNNVPGVGRAVMQTDRWPNAIVALLVDKTTIDAVISQASGPSPDERDSNLCEAFFFIGQYHLLRKQPRLAVESFRAAVALEITHFMEHELALVALKQLAR